MVAAIGDLTQLGDGLGSVAPLSGVPHGGAVERTVEQLILGRHTQRIECMFDELGVGGDKSRS
jgi:hypothetical protein